MQPADIILQEVALKHQIDVKMILSPDARRPVTRARWEAMARIQEERKWSLLKLGMYFGRNHTTVMYGIAMHKALCSGATAEELALLRSRKSTVRP